MIVELIAVGTELLLGNIVNTNSAYLSEMCARLGLSLYFQSVVGDNEQRLKETFSMAWKRSDVVILTGGLGPTKDDLTKEVCAQVLGMDLIEDTHTRARIEHFLEIYQKNSPEFQITENNWKQAMVPRDAIVIDNENGTAPGLILEQEGKTAILLPGPPGELIPMFRDKIYPYLHEKQPQVIYSKMVKICGMGESQVETEIQDLIENQSNPTIATYAKVGEVHLRVTARARNEKEARKLVKPMVRELKGRFGTHIYATEENKTLEEAVVDLLRERKMTLSTVESCTGGAIAARIVNVAGASEVFGFGYVTYSNRAKRKEVQVKKSTLKLYSAVSERTAKEMARGGCRASGSDVCISVTGLAGPDGGTEQTPVGTVFIGCCMNGVVNVQECHFTGGRNKIREQAVVYALTLLRRCMIGGMEL